MPQLRTTVIPHGSFTFPEPSKTREQVRNELNLPDTATVLLSFGHIRDAKNLDLAIHSLAALPSVYLLIAGREQSPGQKPVGYYQALARSLNIENRCRWIHGFVPESEASNLFNASDLVLLAYSRHFRSASGVLNSAVRFRKPCLASAGDSNLSSVVARYCLGWLVEPDNAHSLREGLERALRHPIRPEWSEYERTHSWKRNAELIKERLFC
jgi:glycosyltransferase involved in cell wall biosynthesis